MVSELCVSQTSPILISFGSNASQSVYNRGLNDAYDFDNTYIIQIVYEIKDMNTGWRFTIRGHDLLIKYLKAISLKIMHSNKFLL